MTSKLTDFETPANVTFGEWFTLDNGLRVRATLPTQWNFTFQEALAKTDVPMTTPDGETEKAGAGFARHKALLSAFNDACILEVDDESAKLPLDFDKYYKLVQAVFLAASETAATEAEAVGEKVKK